MQHHLNTPENPPQPEEEVLILYLKKNGSYAKVRNKKAWTQGEWTGKLWVDYSGRLLSQPTSKNGNTIIGWIPLPEISQERIF